MPIYITVTEDEYEKAVATDTGWCCDCKQFSVSSYKLCWHCGGNRTLPAQEAKAQHLFIFATTGHDQK